MIEAEEREGRGGGDESNEDAQNSINNKDSVYIDDVDGMYSGVGGSDSGSWFRYIEHYI